MGISCDRPILTKNITVYVDKIEDAYLPENYYFNSDPLPSEWMELLDGYKLDDTFTEEIPIENAYT